MANYTYDDFGPEAPFSDGEDGHTRKLVNLAGAAMSMALIAGMGIWGYKLLVRDVTGIPVIEALDGQFRNAPEDPGGMTAPHQGLQVNEIAAVGSASEAANEVRLAPEDGILDPEDAPWGEVVEQAQKAGENASMSVDDPALAEEAPEAGQGTTLFSEIVEDIPEDALATDRAVAEALSSDLTFIDDAPAEETGAVTGSVQRPSPRPARLRQTASAPAAAVAVATPEPVAAATSGEVDIASLSSGTRLVQLGAYASPEIVRSEWQRISSKYPDFFAGKQLAMQRTTSGGKTYYRLRVAGFDDLADSRRFCSALTSKGNDCIPVAVQ
ncbi:SPOR domain-containing protein [Palleronia caenipelagi]|uniref:SPOR domain-containing protein n=1 Tax=Palleronia caenipelagi TaxID=2489174 RepID=A0A547PXJ6_9RHOB|nr:SPOR domain-containing protein [Palleronia caenipelagi]TRD18883.1 SPOR domain-containing protein [Palleronia caenipelagi]